MEEIDLSQYGKYLRLRKIGQDLSIQVECPPNDSACAEFKRRFERLLEETVGKGGKTEYLT